MANKRQLKKRIRYACGDIAAECILASHFVPGINTTTMKDIVIKVARLQENALELVSINFDKTPRDFGSLKTYNKVRREYMHKAYCNLDKEFKQNIISIVKEMNAALPSEQKDANVKALK